jgi:hypothetical protein
MARKNTRDDKARYFLKYKKDSQDCVLLAYHQAHQ